jgi:MFS family permease
VTDAPPATRLPRALKPFANGQYRILAVALTMSLFGAGVWIVAVVWQVIALGGSPIELSFVATGSAVGMLLAVLFGGVAADRIPQKRILVAVESSKVIVIGVVAFLAVTGILEVWHLAVAAFILGVGEGFFYPAYSALLPAVLAADDLLAANGVEGVLRPVVMQAAGPAVASAAIAVSSPATAFVIVAAAQALAVAGLLFLRTTPVRRELGEPQHPIKALFGDIGGGFVYMFKTPWLLATLLYACLLVLVIIGPIEVLLPFAVKDQVPVGIQAIFGGGAGAFAVALAAFGIGGAVGSMFIASLKLPRRYLTVMNLLWGVGCVPLVIIGFTDQLWLIVIALFVVGFAFSAATVIWGTLLQRRVPPALLGRVSSLDFFVSLALMPISMAIAGPVGVAIGIPITFVIAGAIPPVLAIAVILIARMPKDEIENPLDPPDDEIDPSSQDVLGPGAPVHG